MTSPNSFPVAKVVGVLGAFITLMISAGCSLLIGPDPSHLKDARAMEIGATPPSRMAPDIVTPDPVPESIEPSPDVVSPEPAPDAAEPDVAEPDTGEPDTEEPAVNPDVEEPEAPEPEPADTDGDGVMDFQDCDKFDPENRWIISEDYSAEDIAQWSVPDGIDVQHSDAGAEFIWEELSSNRDLPFHISPDPTPTVERNYFSMRVMATMEILEHHSSVNSFAAVAFHRGATDLRNCGLESNDTHALGRSEAGERPRTQYSSRIDDVVGAFSVDISVTTTWETEIGEQDLHCSGDYNGERTSEFQFAPQALIGDTSLLLRAKRVLVKSFRVCIENDN